MKPLRFAIALALGTAVPLAGCNGLIGVKDIFLDPGDASAPVADPDATTARTDAALNEDDASPVPNVVDAAEAAPPDAPTCTGTTSDPLNCGACGHDCLGGTCTSGKCAPVKVAVTSGEPWAIAVDGTDIYFTDIQGKAAKGLVFKISKLAVLGAPIQLAETDDELIYDLRIDATHVYFSSGSSSAPGFVERVPLAGGTKQTITPGARSRGLSLDATRIYWANVDSPEDIATAPKTPDAGVTVLAPAQSSPSQTHVDGTRLFWTQETVGGSIRRCTLPACADAADMIVNLYNPSTLATNSTLLFYTAGDTVQQISKNAMTGPGATFVSGQPLPVALVADDKEVAWINLGNYGNNFVDGDIRRCPIVSGTAQCGGTGNVIMSEPNLARGIAMDAKAIYWTVQKTGTIWRIAR